MVKPLSFKGDKKLKKRKRDIATDDGADAGTSSKAVQKAGGAAPTTTNTGDEDGLWVSADTPTDVSGPVVFVLPTEPATCLACDANGKVFASALENMIEGEPATAEPHDVRQVWVATRVAGSDRLGFKGHHGRYLGGDKVGLLTAAREAISFEESFALIPTPDQPGCFALQTARDTFVSADDSSTATSPSVPDIRADTNAITFASTLRVRMQAQFKPKLKVAREERAREKISWKELEEMVGRRLEEHEVKLLKKSRRDGSFHEALLDVKVKGKHDKFA